MIDGRKIYVENPAFKEKMIALGFTEEEYGFLRGLDFVKKEMLAESIKECRAACNTTDVLAETIILRRTLSELRLLGAEIDSCYNRMIAEKIV